MASLVYGLKLASFAGRAATYAYAYAEPGCGEGVSLTVTLPEDALVAEFGSVTDALRVVIKVEDETPAGAWLDSADARGLWPREKPAGIKPAEQLILHNGIWACLDCGAPLVVHSEVSGERLAWVTHTPECKRA